MIDEYAFEDIATDLSPLHDVERIEGILWRAASESRWVSYSEILQALGFRFTRPKMRTLCKTLDAVDARARGRGEPELAVLVVREGDGLPGQGWWTGRRDYQGLWTGPEARKFIDGVQGRAFAHWRAHSPKQQSSYD